MADLSRFKQFQRKSLGTPPAPAQTPGNLSAPEVAPAPLHQVTPAARPFVDGRSRRRTGRVLQFSTRTSEEFQQRFRSIAERDGLQFNELLERALDAYEAQR